MERFVRDWTGLRKVGSCCAPFADESGLGRRRSLRRAGPWARSSSSAARGLSAGKDAKMST